MRNLSILIAAGVLLAAGCTDRSGGPSDDVILPGDDLVGGANTTIFAGNLEASLATPHMSFNSGGAFRTDLPAEANTTGYVLELVWTAAVPANEQLSLWVRDAAAGNTMDPDSFVSPAPPVLRADGPSPLRLVVPMEALEEGVTYSALVRAANDAGAAANQAFDLHVTVFENVPVDEEFTALA